MKRHILISIGLVLTFFSTMATHQRAGEITFRHITGLTYEFTILTYTFAPSPADRPELLINWGDGNSQILARVQIVDLPNDIRRNVYKGQHTYSAPDVYVISMEDPNRNYGIINIPNSVNVPLYVQTELVINPFLGSNNSPVLTIPPIDNGCVGIPYIHNPGAYDPDGDSISYRLIDCKGAGGLIIPGYSMPAASVSFGINAITGDLYWNAPTIQGEFNIAILIEEWRKGVKIGSITRDMQISITACNQDPPVIAPLNDTCVEAGDYLVFDVTATDPNADPLILTGSGAPFAINPSPAQFDTMLGISPLVNTFSWMTDCRHVRKLPYTVYFKAQENGHLVNLVDLETMQITIVGPAPENLNATPLGIGINLQWDVSPCINAKGYHIYRRVDSSGFVPDYCETGVPAYTGYQMIASIDKIDSTSYRDDNLGQGLTQGLVYCYLVVAYYQDGALSYASNESCASLRRDVPIIINNSIRVTDPLNGSVFLRWVQPTELDMTQTPGPFRYRIHRSIGGNPFTFIASLEGLTDTVYIDTLLDTRSQPIRYNIELVNLTPGDSFSVGYSGPASSEFLVINPTDEALILSWIETVPWVNEEYVIRKLNVVSGMFEILDTVNTLNYIDTGLINEQTYCYRIEAIGAYSRPDLPRPLSNWSQENCSEPLDNVSPCRPNLSVNTECEIPANILFWDALYGLCPDDIASYEIFYAPTRGDDPILLEIISPANQYTYTHIGALSIAGCYYVRAIDSLNNQSEFSLPYCIDIDSCNLYKLPNVFTPNGDGFNDEFTPFPYTSVQKVEMSIFNRWGGLVYETEDPGIHWSGKLMNTGQDCSEGVYYYVCDVFEIRLDGPAKRSLQGVVHLMR